MPCKSKPVAASSAADTDQQADLADTDGDGDVDAGFVFLMGDTGIECTDTTTALVGETTAALPIMGSGEVTTDCDAQCHTGAD